MALTATPTPLPTPLPTPTRTPAVVTPSPPTRTASVIAYPANSLVHPIAAAFVGETVYLVDAGQVKAVQPRAGAALHALTPPGGSIARYPIQELATLAYSEPLHRLFLLDRSGAVYSYDLANGWALERGPGGSSDYSQEYPVALAADATYVYLLDTNNGRIWRRNDATWQVLVTSAQLEGGIQLVADGDLYVLVGERPQRAPRLLRVRGTAVSPLAVSGAMDEPTHVVAGPEGTLLLLDQGGRRLRVVEKDTGRVRDSLVVGSSDAEIHALAAGERGILVLGHDWLHLIPPSSTALSLPVPPAVASPSGLPCDLATLSRLPRLRMPIAGARLPDIDRSLPGAPRLYRFGIHEGVDLYTETAGVPIVKGTAVLAAASGRVTRADVDYTEATGGEVDRWLRETQEKRMTPAWIEDKLGGRQVWIDHGGGLSTRYLHLSGVAPGLKPGTTVKSGDVIGYVGNSGTPEAAAGYPSDVHLHFEVRIGDGYLGQWLSPIETRRWLGRLFGED